jgi:Flp pilus assembly protein TadD
MRLARPALAAAVLSWLWIAGCSNLPTSRPNGGPGEMVGTGTMPRNIARLHERQGNLDTAREMYAAMLAERPDDVELNHRMMIVQCRLEQPDEAAKYFETVRRLDPQNAAVLADWGYARYLSGELEQAQTYLRQARELAPNEKRYRMNLGLVVGALGRYDEAWELFRGAVGEAEAHANLGFVCTQRGELDKAKECFSRALDHDPTLKSAQNGLLQIAELQGDADVRPVIASPVPPVPPVPQSPPESPTAATTRTAAATGTASAPMSQEVTAGTATDVTEVTEDATATEGIGPFAEVVPAADVLPQELPLPANVALRSEVALPTNVMPVAVVPAEPFTTTNPLPSAEPVGTATVNAAMPAAESATPPLSALPTQWHSIE